MRILSHHQIIINNILIITIYQTLFLCGITAILNIYTLQLYDVTKFGKMIYYDIKFLLQINYRTQTKILHAYPLLKFGLHNCEYIFNIVNTFVILSHLHYKIFVMLNVVNKAYWSIYAQDIPIT